MHVPQRSDSLHEHHRFEQSYKHIYLRLVYTYRQHTPRRHCILSESGAAYEQTDTNEPARVGIGNLQCLILGNITSRSGTERVNARLQNDRATHASRFFSAVKVYH